MSNYFARFVVPQPEDWNRELFETENRFVVPQTEDWNRVA
jgi:hypothetical protein